jgi:hypothetical protein
MSGDKPGGAIGPRGSSTGASASKPFLFYELLARFPGTALQWWPLSDGGHFEKHGRV